MKIVLTQHQQVAIDKYLQLIKAYPNLFEPRALRRLVTDRRILESYAEQHGEVLGLAAETPYVYFVVDLVEVNNPNDKAAHFPYLRLIYRKQLDGAVNTVVLATFSNAELGPVDSVVMVKQERHATGLLHWELPRGFGETGLSGEQNALKELKEETGYVGENARLIGVTYTDTGMTDAKVSYYHVSIVGKLDKNPVIEEAIEEVRVLSVKEIWTKILSGEIMDSFTVQAMAFYGVNPPRVSH